MNECKERGGPGMNLHGNTCTSCAFQYDFTVSVMFLIFDLY